MSLVDVDAGTLTPKAVATLEATVLDKAVSTLVPRSVTVLTG